LKEKQEGKKPAKHQAPESKHQSTKPLVRQGI
jgi:hypothetical protein